MKLWLRSVPCPHHALRAWTGVPTVAQVTAVEEGSAVAPKPPAALSSVPLGTMVAADAIIVPVHSGEHLPVVVAIHGVSRGA